MTQNKHKMQKLLTWQIIFGLASGLFLMYGVFVTTPTEGTGILKVIAWGFLSVSAVVGWGHVFGGITHE